MCSGGNDLLEYNCVNSSSGQVCGTKHYSCPNGCKNGACIRDSAEDTTGNITCSDTDNGNIYFKGYCHDSRGTNNGWDMCSGGNDLLEYNCVNSSSGQVCGTKHYSCPNGCKNGACEFANVTM